MSNSRAIFTFLKTFQNFPVFFHLRKLQPSSQRTSETRRNRNKGKRVKDSPRGCSRSSTSPGTACCRPLLSSPLSCRPLLLSSPPPVVPSLLSSPLSSLWCEQTGMCSDMNPLSHELMSCPSSAAGQRQRPRSQL